MFVSESNSAGRFIKRICLSLFLLIFAFTGSALIGHKYIKYYARLAYYHSHNSGKVEKEKTRRFRHLVSMKAPRHPDTPWILDALANSYFNSDDLENARKYYKLLLSRYDGNLPYHNEVMDAESFLVSSVSNYIKEELESSFFIGTFPNGVTLRKCYVSNILPINYDAYLSPNWMALLTVINYYENDVDDSAIKNRAARFSKKQGKHRPPQNQRSPRSPSICWNAWL